MVSRRSEDSDGKQCHISFHLHLVDGAQLLHAVFVIELVLPIHGDSEVLRIAADDHLRGDDSRFKKTNKQKTHHNMWMLGQGSKVTSKYCPAVKGKEASAISS